VLTPFAVRVGLRRLRLVLSPPCSASARGLCKGNPCSDSEAALSILEYARAAFPQSLSTSPNPNRLRLLLRNLKRLLQRAPASPLRHQDRHPQRNTQPYPQTLVRTNSFQSPNLPEPFLRTSYLNSMLQFAMPLLMDPASSNKTATNKKEQTLRC
jgi:hypothetical protein